MKSAFDHIIPSLTVRRGKVRDIYNLGPNLLLVSTDRISAYDWVLPTGIPDKGRVLNLLSEFCFRTIPQKNHCLSTDIDVIFDELPTAAREKANRDELAGRSMLVAKTTPFPVECVVRGYIDGSGWKEYLASGTVCDIRLRAGLLQGDKLEEPIFTPATKEESGHDQNIPFDKMCEIVGRETAQELRRLSLDFYNRGAQLAIDKGIIIADTKFEYGRLHDQIMVIDEVLTPDSSRFWPADQYKPGQSQPSLDKQYVRDWLTQSGWDKNSSPPELPKEVVAATRQKYIDAYESLTGATFQWK